MSATTATIRVELPGNLCRLAAVGHEVRVEVEGAVTQRTVLDALEAAYPALRGTLRDQTTKLRRPFIRFFACAQDLSHLSPDEELPEEVVRGRETFLVIGAIAGG
jgi:molybdopterin synthase sulfur carrier subunit